MTSTPHLSLLSADTVYPPFSSEAGGVQESYSSDGPSTPVEWPKASLITAFSVLKLLADEFLESMNLRVIGEVIKCLSAFAAQTVDVNISLTSVEMLWKVSDIAMSPPPPLPLTPPPSPPPPGSLASAVPSKFIASVSLSIPALNLKSTVSSGASIGGFEIFQMMLGCLEDLSMDPRPEVWNQYFL